MHSNAVARVLSRFLRLGRMKKNQTAADVITPLQQLPLVGDLSDQSQDYYSTFDGDVTSPFAEINDKLQHKKLKNLQLAASYERLSHVGYSNDWFFNKSIRCTQCGTDLEFGKSVNDDRWSLFRANFCKDRLCPMCTWRRSLKIFGQVSKIVDELDDYEFLFTTYTIKNVEGQALSDALDRLNYGFQKLMKLKEMKFVQGYFRTIEITRNFKKVSAAYLTYHPHIHCIFVVKRSYFKSKHYLTQARLLELWQRSICDSTVYYVDIRRISRSFDKRKNVETYSAAVAEVAKYSVSADDYLLRDLDLTDDSVFTLATSLNGRRLATMGGLFRKIHKQLNLDDAETGDLVCLDETGDLVKDVVIRFSWGYGFYSLTDIKFAN